MKKLIVSIIAGMFIFHMLPLSAFAAVHTKTYYVPWKDEYRVDHTGMAAGTFATFRLHFVSASNTIYNIDFPYYTGIMYLTCNGTYTLQFLDANENILDESAEIITTQIVNPTCSSYSGQDGANDLNADYIDNQDGSFTLDWTDYPGTDTYEIWKDGVKVGETTDTSFLLDAPGSVTIVAKDATENVIATSDLQVPTYDGGASWNTCNVCKKLSDILSCPDWNVYMGAWQEMLEGIIPPPPDWEEVAGIFVNVFDDYMGDMPTAPTVEELESTLPDMPVLDTTTGTEDLQIDLPGDFDQPLEFDIASTPGIEIIDESEPFEIFDPLHGMETSPVGVGVVPGDPNNSSGDIVHPEGIEGLPIPKPTVTGSTYGDPTPVPGIEYTHSDIPHPADNSTGTGPKPGD